MLVYCFVFCVLCFVFCVLCFVFCVLCFVFCVLCFSSHLSLLTPDFSPLNLPCQVSRSSSIFSILFSS
ncbi:MAG: hypothetical protein EHM93_10435 [Bacteroidales bacterium]|nr:MAG: hypothetical protein EHM93_10435 [Bacteroidales bacterium]